MVYAAFRSGLFYGALISVALALLSIPGWSSQGTPFVITFVLGMLLFVPTATIVGAGLYGGIYAIVGFAFEKWDIRPSPLHCAIAGCVVLLVIVAPAIALLTIFSGFGLGILALLPTAIVGVLVGWTLSRG